jgi:hypothetical protein
MGWGESVSAISVEKITRNYKQFSLVTLCCIDCPLYIVVSCLGCIVSCLVFTLVVVLSVLLSSYV